MSDGSFNSSDTFASSDTFGSSDTFSSSLSDSNYDPLDHCLMQGKVRSYPFRI